MKVLRCGLMFFLLITLGACAKPAPPKVETTFDWKADFSSYRTWMWTDKKPVVADSLIGDDPLDRMIRRAVDRELGNKGLRPVADKPDLLVKYKGKIQAAVSASPGATGYSYNWRWSKSAAGGMQQDSYRKGTLVIDLIDAQTRELVWRGSTSRSLTYEEGARGKIPEVVREILSHYPPRR